MLNVKGPENYNVTLTSEELACLELFCMDQIAKLKKSSSDLSLFVSILGKLDDVQFN